MVSRFTAVIRQVADEIEPELARHEPVSTGGAR
jgi:hypothetical protein